MRATLFVFFVSGASSMLMGNLMPFLRELYGINYTQAGLLLSLPSWGNLASIFITGYLPTYINRNNYQEEVLNTDKPVLLDFWAPWCGPCRMVVPLVEQIAEERPDVKVGKVNIDEQFELAREFGIMTIPTLVVMKDGKVLRQASGARPKNQILQMLEG